MGETSITKSYSDSSSDSGYDESSNQGVIFNGYTNKKEHDCLVDVKENCVKTELTAGVN